MKISAMKNGVFLLEMYVWEPGNLPSLSPHSRLIFPVFPHIPFKWLPTISSLNAWNRLCEWLELQIISQLKKQLPYRNVMVLLLNFKKLRLIEKCCYCCCFFFFTRNVVLFHGRSTSTHVFLDHNGLTSAPHDKLITLFFFFFVLLINRR